MDSKPATDPFNASKRTKKSDEKAIELIEISEVTNESEDKNLIINSLKSSAESANIFKQIFAKKKEHTESKKELLYNKDDFKNSSNGKEWNLKLVTWNINGIRAWIQVLIFGLI